MHSRYCLVGLSAFCIMGASRALAVSAGVPLLDVRGDGNGQVVGQLPVAAVGTLNASTSGVSVDVAQAGMTGQTIRFEQLTSENPRLIGTPLGEPFSAGQRRMTFQVNYDHPGNGTNTPELFQIRFADSNLNDLAKIVIAGNNATNLNVPAGDLGVIVGSTAPVVSAFSSGSVHALTVLLDADLRNIDVLLDGTSVLGTPAAWPAAINNVAFVDFTLVSRAAGNGATSGLAHIDNVLFSDPTQPLQEWMGGVDSNWTTAGNWVFNTSPVSGTVFIRKDTGGDVIGPPTNLSVPPQSIFDNLLVSNAGNPGTASLRLAAEFDVDGLAIGANGKIVIPTGAELHVASSWALSGTLRFEGGALSGATFSNNVGGLVSGFGNVNAPLVVNAGGATIQADPGTTLAFNAGTVNDSGTLDCNGGRINLGSNVALIKAAGNASLNGGTLHSPKALELTTLTGRFDGPGTLEVGGIFQSALPAAQMSLSAMNIVLIGDTSFEALSKDSGKNGHTLNGLSNVLGSLAVGANALTLADNFGHTGGANALYVKNLDLSNTTKDVAGGKVYYQSLTGGKNTFANYIDLSANAAPVASISSPTGDVSIQTGQSVKFTATASDPDNSPGAITYQWSFGSGSGVADSTAQNPGDVAFANAGTFKVTLTVKDGEGLASAEASRTITVTAPSGAGSGDQNPGGDQNSNGGAGDQNSNGGAQVVPTTAACGTCGALSPEFSLALVASYGGMILRRRSRRMRATRARMPKR